MSEADKKQRAGCGVGVNSRRAYSVLVAMALCLVLTLAAESLAEAQAPTTSRCQPEWSLKGTNEQATVCIYVQDVVGLYGADFEMSFPGMVGIATVADEDSGTPGVQILRNWTWVPSGWVVFANEANNSTGYLHYLIYGWNPAPAIDGSGPIACMRFQPGAAGEFYMTFTRHDLSDRSGNLITNNANTCRVTFYDPTSVFISDLEALPEGAHILVTWETTSELDNAGFNLYRGDSPEGSQVQLNGALIPSQVPGGTGGASYSWLDRGCASGSTYYYWLESLGLNGHTARYGPVSATCNGPNAVSFQGMTARRANSAGLWLISCLAAAVALYGGWRRLQGR